MTTYGAPTLWHRAGIDTTSQHYCDKGCVLGFNESDNMVETVLDKVRLVGLLWTCWKAVEGLANAVHIPRIRTLAVRSLPVVLKLLLSPCCHSWSYGRKGSRKATTHLISLGDPLGIRIDSIFYSKCNISSLSIPFAIDKETEDFKNLDVIALVGRTFSSSRIR